jgi:hypothetical protein
MVQSAIKEVMTIGSVGSAAAASQANVAVQKKEQDQQEKVVGTLLESVKSAPAPDGKGGKINAIA